MKRTYGLAGVVALGAVVVGWAAIALAQGPGEPPAAAPVTGAQPVTPAAAPAGQFPAPQPGNPYPAPTPVMPATPGTVPAPVAPVSPPAMTPAAPQTVVPAQAPGSAPAPSAEQSAPMPVATAVTADAQPDAGAAQDPNNPTGRQEPAVSIEWLGPAAAKVGQACDYSIVVRNACNIPVQQVLVRVRLAGAASVIATEPKALAEENILMWEVGTLLPKQEKNLQLRMMSNTRGDIAAQAWVTFTGATALRVRVREPKLVVKASAPEKVLVGDATNFMLTVSNPGDGLAERVLLHAQLSEGLEHPRGSKVDFDLGNLSPGESRSVQVVCLSKAAGEQSCTAFAEADAGLKAQDKAACAVIMPRLDLEAKGPKLRYLDRKAVYTIKVTNPGDAPASNVSVSDLLPAGFKFVAADGGGRHDYATRTVSWFLGEIAPGQSREVNLEVMCVNAGEFTHKIAAQASRGLKVEGEALTRVEGLSAILLEMVDLEDPVEVNGETIYEIRITNTGSKTETDVKLMCTLPADKEQFKTASGPSPFHVEGNEIIFDSLPKLAPRADAIYRVTVKCTAPGIAHFKSRITSAILTEPVSKEEATRIYAD
jgi:Domain of unknown function DUF11